MRGGFVRVFRPHRPDGRVRRVGDKPVLALIKRLPFLSPASSLSTALTRKPTTDAVETGTR